MQPGDGNWKILAKYGTLAVAVAQGLELAAQLQAGENCMQTMPNRVAFCKAHGPCGDCGDCGDVGEVAWPSDSEANGWKVVESKQTFVTFRNPWLEVMSRNHQRPHENLKD